jgi:DNA-binding response OmpR family regulator
MTGTTKKWVILVVEDEREIVRQIKEYFTGITFEGLGIEIREYTTIEDAKTLIRAHKADLVILDVFQGEQSATANKPGVEVFEKINELGFVPVVFYTALPEQVKHLGNTFVKIVNKPDGLRILKARIQELFDSKVPQLTRRLYDHVDKALGRYMWDYAQERWPKIEAIADKPELMRIIMARLSAVEASPEKVHAAEYYVAPPLSSNLRFDLPPA